MASYRKLKGKYYARVRYIDKTGKDREKLIGLKTANRSRADKLLAEINNQEEAFKKGLIALDDIQLRQAVTTFQKLTDAFLDYLQTEKNDKPDTLRNYRYTFELLEKIYDNDINLYTLDRKELVEKLRDRFNNLNTVNCHLRNIRAFLNWANEENYIFNLPVKIRLLSTPRKSPRYFTDKELLEILKNVPDTYIRARIYVHWKTGIRLSEFDNTYLNNGFLRVYNPLKGGKERSIKIDEETKLNYQLAQKCPHIGTTISKEFLAVIRTLGLAQTKEGDKRTFHALRHTFAVRKYAETQDIYKVSKLLGHASVKTTEIYAQFNLEEITNDFDFEDEAVVPKKRADRPETNQFQQDYKNAARIAYG